MISMLFEAVVLAFVIGGIIGAVSALHRSGPKIIPVRIERDTYRHNRPQRR